MTTGNLVPIERHNRLIAGPAVWTDTRVPIEVFGIACAVYGAGSEDDDKRIYRTIQAVLWKLATQSPAQEESPAAPVQPVGEPFAYVHKRGADDEEFIHATAVNGHCADCEPLFLGAAISTRPELSDAEIDALRKKAARYEWLRDSSEPPHNFYLSVPVEFHGVRYQPSEVDAYIDAALAAARGEKPLVQGSGS